jgi:cob(I)alamin adenosyltransferase
MGNRLSTIVTRTGDKGTTGLADGSRRDKRDLRIHSLGDVDELNASIGIVICHISDESIREILHRIQHDLFDIGAELCQPDKSLITQTYIDALEHSAEKYNSDLPPLKEFILPGGGADSAFLHQSRTICRRVERGLAMLKAEESVNSLTAAYINRLSDLLFILARTAARLQGGKEVNWQSKYSRTNVD